VGLGPDWLLRHPLLSSLLPPVSDSPSLVLGVFLYFMRKSTCSDALRPGPLVEVALAPTVVSSAEFRGNALDAPPRTRAAF
jgi:hypothetical protein